MINTIHDISSALEGGTKTFYTTGREGPYSRTWDKKAITLCTAASHQERLWENKFCYPIQSNGEHTLWTPPVADFLRALHWPSLTLPPRPLNWITQRRRLVLYQCISSEVQNLVHWQGPKVFSPQQYKCYWLVLHNIVIKRLSLGWNRWCPLSLSASVVPKWQIMQKYSNTPQGQGFGLSDSWHPKNTTSTKQKCNYSRR